MWLPVWRDVLYRVQAQPPRFGHAGEVAGRVLGPHDRAPQLLSRGLSQQTRPGRPASRPWRDGRELALGEPLRGVDDLGPHALDQRDVDPPEIAAAERLTPHQG